MNPTLANWVEVNLTVGLIFAIAIIVGSAVYVWMEGRARKTQQSQDLFRTTIIAIPEVAPEEEPEPLPEKRRPGRPRGRTLH